MSMEDDTAELGPCDFRIHDTDGEYDSVKVPIVSCGGGQCVGYKEFPR